ncbi:hypothetical protein BD779DRAFT_1473084 [Infundibulicybe gibba]|nr:hypothetical protein BD779DRAFT_1473084 [Infundibulicybe gibba]
MKNRSEGQPWRALARCRHTLRAELCGALYIKLGATGGTDVWALGPARQACGLDASRTALTDSTRRKDIVAPGKVHHRHRNRIRDQDLGIDISKVLSKYLQIVGQTANVEPEMEPTQRELQQLVQMERCRGSSVLWGIGVNIFVDSSKADRGHTQAPLSSTGQSQSLVVNPGRGDTTSTQDLSSGLNLLYPAGREDMVIVGHESEDGGVVGIWKA